MNLSPEFSALQQKTKQKIKKNRKERKKDYK